ncbi:hypothetical protein PI125_g5145 [Phytophthora idaei]|nr:hypothetical protein PI125_g5145 [Phytophthora idaei]
MMVEPRALLAMLQENHEHQQRVPDARRREPEQQ